MGTIRARLGWYKRRLLGQPLPARRSHGPTAVGRDERLERKLAELNGDRMIGPLALQRMLDFLTMEAEVVLPMREAAPRVGHLPTKAVLLRHDIDRDIEAAMRMAALEEAVGVRSTYFVLHTAWFYRWQSGEQISQMTLNALAAIATMGHEIGLHNDAIGVAVQTGRDPLEVLSDELEQLRAHGFDVVGTSAHGNTAVLAAGLVNHHVFAERVIADQSFTPVGSGRPVTFTPRPLASFGLQYEAYGMPGGPYLSDAGGRWNVAPQWSFSELARGKGPMQILTHPEAWALSGETLRVRPAPKSKPWTAAPRSRIAPVTDRDPLKIIGRADCCSRRAIHMNQDMFGGHVRYVKDEKSRTDFLVDHAMVGSPTRVEMLRHVAVDKIRDHSHRHYQFCQTDRATLEGRDADLIILDSYGDMNFQAWQHRTSGWRMWAPLAYLRDRKRFEQDFTSVGYLSLEDSIHYHIELINHYRRMNGHIPVLFLTQPITYYLKLDHRREFLTLGPRLEELVPDLYAGFVDDKDLEPDDMDSNGPGQTLHFKATTYRRMIEVALEKGLDKWLSTTRLSHV